ncbi:MAG: ABC transporter transmembrane domain-containing protein [Romboutsia sp.]
MFIKINQYSLRQIDKITRASLITRTTNDVTQLQQFVHGMMRVFIKSPIVCLGSFILAIKLNFKMSLIILVAISIIFLVIIVNMKVGYRFLKNVQGSTDKVNSNIRQYLGGTKIVKLFGREEYEVGRFEKQNEELFVNVRVRELISRIK